jgi:hypothetical protein
LPNRFHNDFSNEIPTLLRGEIDGHQCEINKKTGLPKGMNENTTADNFIVFRGGYNCGHQLIPVNEAVIPKELKDKIKAASKPAKPEKTPEQKKSIQMAWDERKKLNMKIDKLGELIPDARKYVNQFGFEKVQAVFAAVQAKLASWENLSLTDKLKNVKYEIKWVEDNKKYDTWEAAQKSYQKYLKNIYENDYETALDNYSTVLAAANKNVTDKKVVAAKDVLTEFEHYISNKNYPNQKSVLSESEMKAAAENLTKYLAEKGINPNDIFGDNIGGVFDAMRVERENYAKELKDVTSEELSLVTRFTSGNTFSNAYELRNISPYWKKVWENKIIKLKPSEIIKIEKIISKYTVALNGIINKLKRFDGIVYRGVKSGGGGEMINEFEKLWKDGTKIWTNPNQASTSTSAAVAERFDGAYENGLILVIKNKTGGYIQPVSAYSHELEVLLMKGSKYKILKEPYNVGKVKYVELEEI